MNSQVRLSTKYSYNKTVYDDVYFTAPYKIIAPLYEDEEAQIIIMSSSAGLLKDDVVEMDFDFGANTKAKISSQSYEKVFDTQSGIVKKNVSINIAENACIRYMPHPTIPFKNSNYLCNTTINLSKNSCFFYSDIFTCGRVFMDEVFLMNKFQSLVKIYIEGKIAFADNTLIEPKNWNYNTLGLWHEFSHNGLLFAYFDNEKSENDFIDFARAYGAKTIPNFELGVSRAFKGICVRVLGDNGDKIYNYFNEISSSTN